MKTVIASLLLSVLVSGASFATDNNPATLPSAVYPSSNATTVNVIVNQSTERNTAVRLLDQNGLVLAQQFIGKSSKATMTRFNLSQLKDGVYQVEIVSGQSKEVKQIQLTTNQPTVTSPRTVVMN